MGIKDETPDDKVIFDSIDNRMKYSNGSTIIPNVARQEAGLEPKTDNPKNMDDIYNVLNLILEELKNGKKEN